MKVKYFSKDEISSLDRITRLNLINSISGFKSANLIGTRNKAGQNNVAIFSSVIHLGSDPALLGFILRPDTVPRHTYDNILETSVFTVNHVKHTFAEKAHYTAAKFEKDESEFEKCGLQPHFISGFEAPYVKESKVKIGLRFVEEKSIETNGCKLIIGAIEHIYIEGEGLHQDGGLDLVELGTMAISGVNRYHRTAEGQIFPYPRTSELPQFEVEEEKPSYAVYDEESGKYNASLLPYASDVGGPAFKVTDLTLWKNTSAGKVSSHFKSRFEELKGEYQAMIEQFSWNETVYTAKFSFEPVVGETYHLYEKQDGERFLSLIPPDSWNRSHLGSFQLNTEKMWVKI
jgi:flavin reductase (DIM6/NTAB) family NADH-FMN oxidoreductase RutF